MVLPGELPAIQFTGVQSEQPPRVRAPDQLRHPKEVHQWKAGQAPAKREHVGLLLLPGVPASNWQVQHVAGADLSRNAQGHRWLYAGLTGEHGPTAKYLRALRRRLHDL